MCRSVSRVPGGEGEARIGEFLRAPPPSLPLATPHTPLSTAGPALPSLLPSLAPSEVN